MTSTASPFLLLLPSTSRSFFFLLSSGQAHLSIQMAQGHLPPPGTTHTHPGLQSALRYCRVGSLLPTDLLAHIHHLPIGQSLLRNPKTGSRPLELPPFFLTQSIRSEASVMIHHKYSSSAPLQQLIPAASTIVIGYLTLLRPHPRFPHHVSQ